LIYNLSIRDTHIYNYKIPSKQNVNSMSKHFSRTLQTFTLSLCFAEFVKTSKCLLKF